MSAFRHLVGLLGIPLWVGYRQRQRFIQFPLSTLDWNGGQGFNWNGWHVGF